MFGSITYLEIKNYPIGKICDLQHLRNQLKTMKITKSKVENLKVIKMLFFK